jgi:hypothetical protein
VDGRPQLSVYPKGISAGADCLAGSVTSAVAALPWSPRASSRRACAQVGQVVQAGCPAPADAGVGHLRAAGTGPEHASGGVDPLALAGDFLITVGLAVLGCTLAPPFSLWAAKPYESLLATYCAYGIWLLVLPTWDFLGRLWSIPTSPDWAIPFSPFYLAFAPYVLPGKVGVLSYAGFFAAMLAISAVLAAIAIKRMRAVIAGRAGRSAGANAQNVGPPGQRRGSNGRRWLRTDRDVSLDDGPVFWYETRRRVYSPWIQVMLRTYLVLKRLSHEVNNWGADGGIMVSESTITPATSPTPSGP